MRTDFYRDMTIWQEAFKAGQFDLKTENSSKEWSTGYNIPAVTAGDPPTKLRLVPRHYLGRAKPRHRRGGVTRLARGLL